MKDSHALRVLEQRRQRLQVRATREVSPPVAFVQSVLHQFLGTLDPKRDVHLTIYRPDKDAHDVE